MRGRTCAEELITFEDDEDLALRIDMIWQARLERDRERQTDRQRKRKRDRGRKCPRAREREGESYCLHPRCRMWDALNANYDTENKNVTNCIILHQALASLQPLCARHATRT